MKFNVVFSEEALSAAYTAVRKELAKAREQDWNEDIIEMLEDAQESLREARRTK